MFKSLQVLRLAKDTVALLGATVPKDTRVRVIREDETNGLVNVLVRVQDEDQPHFNKLRLCVAPGDLIATKRGRPASE